ncbi:MAG TPA: endonuclease MutS2 [Clostridiales bacterium]|nr:MAG: endonuclease MutS2 [Clostridiales bacterium GWD2_32_19]HCC07159.1 endonuclease MutS2 [Clostridiales bacterium]
MNKRALKTLEYNKIIDKLVEYAVSPMAKEQLSILAPYDEMEVVKTKQRETTDAVFMLVKKSSIPLGVMKDIRLHIKRMEMGSSLNIRELLEVADTLDVCSRLSKYYNSDKRNEEYPSISSLFEDLVEFKQVVNEINRCIKSEEEIDDNASTELSSVRKQISAAQNKVKEKLSSIIQSSSYKTMLQDAIITMRENRYCVPIKQEFRHQFKGIVHDQSSTGATLFIEPLVVVELNNKIRDLEIKEKEEIDKILKTLTDLVAENIDIVRTNLELLTEIDVIFARAKLSRDMKGSEPIYNDRSFLNLKMARHPLIKTEDVVPVDIYLGKDFVTLIITGPNTGGKTVTLKTVGLFALMGQSGLHIPAFDNSELCMFDEIFADIGDEQSIEQSLSTFSSHMKNIVSILENVTSKSLALFDELGAGTDPVEGAALAMAILKKLHERKIRTIATTHYSELKVYALRAEGVENASCEFDVATLRPTYKILIGVPGKSNAFLISKKLGLKDDVINSAQELISQENIKMEEVITKLEIDKKEAEAEKKLAEDLRKEIEKIKIEIESQKDKLDSQKEKIIREAKEEAHKVYSRAKVEADEMMKELNEAAREAKKVLDQKDIQEIRQKISSNIKNIQTEMTKDFLDNKKVNPNPPTHLKLGETVFVSTFDQNGTVATLPDNKGELFIQIGIMKVKVSIQSVFLVKDKNRENITKKFEKGNASTIRMEKVQSLMPEINLIGKYVDEALCELDKFIDNMGLSNVEKIRVVHGKGTGALRRGVQDYLKDDARVESYRQGAYGEGDLGVTIVELK